MRHLYSSRVAVYRLDARSTDGQLAYDWVYTGEQVDCRLDLNFIRPGKDQPPAIEAGKAPDRFGVMFCDALAPIKAGDHLACVPNVRGQLPIKGTFEIRAVPDEAQAYGGAHHIEVQIIEIAQALTGVFPGSTDGY